MATDLSAANVIIINFSVCAIRDIVFVQVCYRYLFTHSTLYPVKHKQRKCMSCQSVLTFSPIESTPQPQRNLSPVLAAAETM